MDEGPTKEGPTENRYSPLVMVLAKLDEALGVFVCHGLGVSTSPERETRRPAGIIGGSHISAYIRWDSP